jgi:hypothetical protein
MSELYHPRHTSPVLWWIAGVAAVTLHVGCVAFAFLSTQREDEPDLGAPAIEIGVELASPKLDPTDLPIGPDTDAAAPSPALVEQKAVIEKTDLPTATPTETDDPDRIVSPNETEEPKEDEPKVVTMPTPASAESIVGAHGRTIRCRAQFAFLLEAVPQREAYLSIEKMWMFRRSIDLARPVSFHDAFLEPQPDHLCTGTLHHGSTARLLFRMIVTPRPQMVSTANMVGNHH